MVLSAGANSAPAWGHQGHATVGYIAALLIKGTNSGKQVTVIKKRGAGPGKSPCQASDGKSKGSVWDIELPDHYANDGAITANDQLAKAGARLAKLLKAIWP
jgi:hypothetical protein